MSTLRRKLIRLSNWTKRLFGLPSFFVDNESLKVTITDGRYLIKTSVRNLTNKVLHIRAEALVRDNVGPLSFENLLSVDLMSSAQCFLCRKHDVLPKYGEDIRVLPYDEVDIEIASVCESDGSILLPHRQGVSGILSKDCSLTVKIAGAGLPRIFVVRLEGPREGTEHAIVKQRQGLKKEAQVLDLVLSDPGSTDKAPEGSFG